MFFSALKCKFVKSLTALDALRLTRGIMAELGVVETRDLTPFRDLALVEVAKEFAQHYGGETLLCSSCPGFVCYAEKTNSKLLVPKLSKVRSPQQISGLSLKLSKPNSYHVTIMPCYDKKLEAVRQVSTFSHEI